MASVLSYTAAQRRHANHPLDAPVFQGGAGRLAEAYIGVFDALRAGIAGNQPKHRLGPLKRPVHNGRVAVRALHDINLLAHLRRQTGGVARNDP